MIEPVDGIPAIDILFSSRVRQCSRCRKWKYRTAEFFHRQSCQKSGLAPHCKECAKAIDRKYSPRKTDRRVGVRRSRAEQSAIYRERHREKIKAANRQPLRRIRGRLSGRLYVAFKGQKPATAMKLLGCTTEELRVWLELQFKPGMTLDNYGEWEMDHRRPLASFDLSDPAQAAEACHYTNIQPLWRSENRAKRDRWP